jgi:ankyrin repeat protein
MSKNISRERLEDLKKINLNDGNTESSVMSIISDATQEQNFNINIRDEQGRTFLSYAIASNLTNPAASLVSSKANPQIPGNDGRTPLHYATENLNVSAVELLLRAKATVDISAGNGLTPVWNTVINCIANPQKKAEAFQILELLKDANFEVQLPLQIQVGGATLVSKNMIPFFYASTATNSSAPAIGREVAEKLLSLKPVNPYITDSNGWGYLHWLLSVRDPISLFEDVRAQGADVDAQDINGETCLHWTPNLNEGVINWFVSHGASLNINNKKGQTALSKAFELISLNKSNDAAVSFLTEISKALLLAGLKYETMSLSAKNFKYAFELKLLNEFLDKIDSQKVINEKLEGDSTYLHVSSQNYGSSLAYKLITMKADVNSVDDKGYTPLHLAAQRGGDKAEGDKATGVVKTLIEQNASINTIAKDGTTTPLSLACTAGNKASVGLLLKQDLSQVPPQTINQAVVEAVRSFGYSNEADQLAGLVESVVLHTDTHEIKISGDLYD